VRSFEITPLRTSHLEDAAALWEVRYRTLRQSVPCLPCRCQGAEDVLPRLQELIARSPGVAALRRSQLVGYLIGFTLPEFRGRRAVYSPEWANGAQAESNREIYAQMYSHLSAQWAADGSLTHLVGMLAHDREGIEGWHWLGFGLAAADAVRSLDPVQGPRAEVQVRRAGSQEIEQVMSLTGALERHLAAAPIFLASGESEDRVSLEAWLADSANALWLAYDGVEVLGLMRLGPASHDACDIIVDEGTSSITGAFTRENARQRGVGTSLLNCSLNWARSEGYVRCAVDFEPMNVPGARFWTSRFDPVCFALARRLDERIAPAHGRRDASDPDQ
jgi:GNAT superfamily N-acetyltransferase